MTSDQPGTPEQPPAPLLSAEAVQVPGDHQPLLPATTLILQPGQVLAGVGEPGHGHTALALALAGRLDCSGRITLGDSADERQRQRAVAMVDVPGVSAPDGEVPIGVIVREELAMAGLPTGREESRRWLGEVPETLRTEDVPAAFRLELLLRLAARRQGVRFLVTTLPERSGVTPAQWEPVARDLADQDLGVLVTVGHVARDLLTVERTTLWEELG